MEANGANAAWPNPKGMALTDDCHGKTPAGEKSMPQR